MTTLYVTDYTSQGLDGNGHEMPVAFTPHNQTQTVAIGASSAQTANAVSNNSTLIRVHTDSVCSINIGVNPTAAATGPRLAANQTEYFTCPLNSGYKVAVIVNT